jgi:hypothetical protein
MTQTRSAWIIVAVLAATLIGAGAAAAQEYPVQSGTLTVGDDPAEGSGEAGETGETATPPPTSPGQEVRIAGGGFVPGSEVTVTIESDPIVLGVTTADANGEIDVMMVLPVEVPIGDHTLKASGDAATGGRLILEKAVEVAEPLEGLPMEDPASSGGLSYLMIAGIALLVLAGAAMAIPQSRDASLSFIRSQMGD